MIQGQKFIKLLIYSFRIFFAIGVFINPLLTVLFAIYLDWIDMRALKGFGISLKGYNRDDKLTDTIVYFIFFVYIISVNIDSLITLIFLILFIIRMIGYILFVISQNRKIFFIFPNIFFSFFVVYNLILFFNPFPDLQIILISLIWTIIFQFIFEYGYHVSQLALSEDYLSKNYNTTITNLAKKIEKIFSKRF